MRPIPTLLLQTSLLAAAVGLGWMLRGSPQPEVVRMVKPASSPGAAPARTDGTLIAISDDGRATLRVEQQPLDWVLEEIERQSGRRLARIVQATASVVPAPSAEPASDSCTLSVEPARTADAARVLQAIEGGSEADRFDGLQQARAEGFPVAPGVLKTVFETDASERVRLAAFEAWLEANADRPELLRPALEAALAQSGSAVPAEARRRLEELRAMEQADPADPQPHPSP